MPGLGIDLPVVRGPSGYPLCRVAMYLAAVAQPREPGITFIYAHARRGMFLPLLTRYRADGGRSLIGKTVKVWTSDSYVSYYRILQGPQDEQHLGRLLADERTALAPDLDRPELHLREAHRRGVALQDGEVDVRVRSPDPAPGSLLTLAGRRSALPPWRYPRRERGDRDDDETRGLATVRRGRDRRALHPDRA